MKKIFIYLIMIIGGLLLFNTSVSADIASGTSGTCEWAINTAGKLVIQPLSDNSCRLENVQSLYSAPWYNNRNDIKSVEVKPGVKTNAYASYLFNGLKNATSIDVTNLDTSNAIGLSGMFYNCSSLTSLDVSNFNTGNVTDMISMFYGCSSLTSLDVSKFNTSKVRYMHAMFSGCSSLTSLDVSNFNTGNVRDMSGMFYNCNNLTSLDVSKFNTSNVTTMAGMFRGCSSLTSLDVSNFITSKVTNMASMFNNTNFTKLDLSNFNTSNVESFYEMFGNTKKLVSLNISSFDTVKASEVQDTFLNMGSEAKKGTEIIFGNNFANYSSNFDTGNSGFSFPYANYIMIENDKEVVPGYSLTELKTKLGTLTENKSFVPGNTLVFDYETNGGSYAGENTFTHRLGTKIDARGILPTKKGYTFTGWTDTQDGKNPKMSLDVNSISNNTYGDNYNTVNPVTVTNNKIILYAQFEAIENTITFESNGGSPVESIKAKTDESITKPTDPTKEGHIFKGWYEDKNFSKEFKFDKMPAENITLYAKWEEYKVLNGDQTHVIGKSNDMVIETNAPLERFSHIEIDGKILDKENYSLKGEHTILTLKKEYLDSLKPDKYTLTFVYNDGKVSTNIFVVEYNDNQNNNNQEDNKDINNKDKKDNQKQEDAANPQTGDNITSYIWILLISLTGLISGIVYLSKNKLKSFLAK